MESRGLLIDIAMFHVERGHDGVQLIRVLESQPAPTTRGGSRSPAGTASACRAVPRGTRPGRAISRIQTLPREDVGAACRPPCCAMFHVELTLSVPLSRLRSWLRRARDVEPRRKPHRMPPVPRGTRPGRAHCRTRPPAPRRVGCGAVRPEPLAQPATIPRGATRRTPPLQRHVPRGIRPDRFSQPAQADSPSPRRPYPAAPTPPRAMLVTRREPPAVRSTWNMTLTKVSARSGPLGPGRFRSLRLRVRMSGCPTETTTSGVSTPERGADRCPDRFPGVADFLSGHLARGLLLPVLQLHHLGIIGC